MKLRESMPRYRGRSLSQLSELLRAPGHVIEQSEDIVVRELTVSGFTETWHRYPGTKQWFERVAAVPGRPAK